jgi:hypothetical protein
MMQWYRDAVRTLVVLACVACGRAKEAPAPATSPSAGDASPASPSSPDATELPAHRRFATLDEALLAIIPDDARVLGFGELHARTDRANVRSSLAAFTSALPALGNRISDLVLETWVVDPKCGAKAVATTKKLEAEVRRPATTKSELALLIDAAKTAGIKPHAMTLSCADYATLAPDGGAPDPVAMLTLTTRELGRIATSAIAYRDRQADSRPWIAIYGGALHNDRFPEEAVAEWSYAAAVDRASGDRFVELDVIVPELAEPDPASQRQPWFPLVAAAREVLVWQRGERSFVILLPRAE